jgi:addiction module HigA family antidote
MSHATDTMFPPVHPGEILLEEFMVPAALSQNALARALHIPVSRVNALVRGERAITAETALRLARYFGTTPDLWLSMQSGFDLAQSREVMAEDLAEIEPRRAAG